MMKEIYSNELDTCMVSWQFTSMCNFACTYCPEEFHDNKVKFPKYDDALYFLQEFSKNHKKIYIELLGGETTLWPKLLDFLREIKKISNVVVQIDTNGSRSTRWWEEFNDSDLEMNVILNFSYHGEFCDPDIYYDNLAEIHEKYQVVSSFMLDPLHFKKTHKLYNRIKDNLAVDCIYKVLRPNFHPNKLIDGYTTEMLAEIDKHKGYDRSDKRFPYKRADDDLVMPTTIFVDGKEKNWQIMLTEKDNSFKNWKCSAGVKRLFIGLDGNIWPCSALRQWGNDKTHEDYLGNIHERTYKAREQYMACPKEYCGCKFDALAHKYKDETPTTI